MRNDRLAKTWKTAYWTLFFAWISGAAMNMWHVHGGFLTNYLADLAFPPWYYIVIRGLTTTGKKPPFLLRWFSVSAGRALISILLSGVVYEMGQRYQIIPGTFDLWDIVAYGIGPSVCYVCERRQRADSKNAALFRGGNENSEHLL
jgi:hypothetical protein